MTASWLSFPSGLLDVPTDTELWFADDEPTTSELASVSCPEELTSVPEEGMSASRVTLFQLAMLSRAKPRVAEV